MNLKALLEKKNELITRAEDIVNGAMNEKRELTDAEAQEVAEIRDNVKHIKDVVDAMQEMHAGEQKMKDDNTNAEDTVEKQEERAFDAYLRGIVLNTRDGATELTKADNGAVIPTTIADRIIKRVYDICPVLERSQKYNAKGNLDIPYYDTETSTINVAYSDELTALTSSAGKFRSITLTGYLAGALSKVSRSLVNNSTFDLVSFVVEEMAESIKRFIEHELLVGTEGKVTGLSTLTNIVNSASATALTADDLIDTQDAVKDVFQNNAIWIMSTKTRNALRKLKDKEGHYILNDDLTSPFGKVLLGKPVYCSDNMPEIGAGNTAVYYGDLTGLATKFNENINVQVLREKYADEHKVGVIGWFEFDSKVQNAQKLSKLVCGTASV